VADRDGAVRVEGPPAPHHSQARGGSLQEGRKRFAAHGATGAYLRVLETGEIGAGDPVEVVSRPDHGLTVGAGFRIVMKHPSRLPELAPALEFLPVKDQPKLAARIEQRLAARS
jgi:MOSC domain-containing protein YiiM